MTISKGAVIRKHISPGILAALRSGELPHIRGGLICLLRRISGGNFDPEYLQELSVHELCEEIDNQGMYRT